MMSVDHETDCVDMSRVTALVLAGGFGTRLRSVISDRPKVLADVHNRPFITYLLDQLVDSGVRNAVLCTGYMADLVEKTLGKSYRGMRLRYSCETEPLGTGGALRLALSQVDSDLVLAMNGDSYCDADLKTFIEWHTTQDFLGSLLLTNVDDTGRYGLVRTDEAGRVLSFEEKGSVSGPSWINAGIYLLPRELLTEIALGSAVSLERDMLPNWIQQSFGGFQCPSQFLDIGLPESYAETEAFFAPMARQASA
jgi:D-glycero-alpha-D-manno-heptose 1-phosphate guanylyltransferase